jgi:RNA polymerase sigma factor (sigma-70 family)
MPKPNILDEILRLRSQGYSQAEIARRLGCTQANVSGTLKKNGYKTARFATPVHKAPLDRSRLNADWQAYLTDRSVKNRNRLAVANQGLVRHVIAKRFSWACKREGFQVYEDLMQEGNIGLIKAIERFDPDTGNAFSSFATKTIWGNIMHWLRDFRAIKNERGGKLAFVFSLDALVLGTEEPETYLSQLPCPKSDEDRDEIAALIEEIAFLPSRQREIVGLRLQGNTLGAAAKTLNCSQTTAAYHQQKAIRNLRQALAHAS